MNFPISREQILLEDNILLLETFLLFRLGPTLAHMYFMRKTIFQVFRNVVVT